MFKLMLNDKKQLFSIIEYFQNKLPEYNLIHFIRMELIYFLFWIIFQFSQNWGSIFQYLSYE